MTLNRKVYMETDGRGIAKLFCKVCGAQIAQRTRRGQMNFFDNYAEVKFRFLDGSFHVTNLCANCVKAVQKDRLLAKEVHDADIDFMARSVPGLTAQKRRLSPRVVTVDYSKSGIP
jgi:hypothetical protein